MNQAHDRTNDTDSRGIPAHALVHLGRHQIVILTGQQVDLKNTAQGLRLAAVHQQLQSLASENIALQFGNLLKPEQTFLAGDRAPLNDLADALLQAIARRDEDPARDYQRALEHFQRRLDESRAQGAAKHNQCGRAVDQRCCMPSLEVIATQYGDKREDDANDAEDVHQLSSAR